MLDMNSKSIIEEKIETIMKKTVLLNIPPRLQWANDYGYCGETALQSIGLYYGAWISQKLIRDINKGEYLLQPVTSNDHREPLRTLTLLHFTYNEWDWINSPQPQFQNFCHWMKRSILRRHPVIFGIFLRFMSYKDYDHIVPAVGIQYQNEDQYDQHDKIIYHDLFDVEQIEKNLNEDEFGSTRETIDAKKNANDGCLPLNVDYGIAITGIVDEDCVTLPVHLSVSEWDEPNPTYHEDPKEMLGIVTVNNLTIGCFYALLRYSSYKSVPTRGDANAFLHSNFDERHEFMATSTDYGYEDPMAILSSGSVYYRCVLIPE
ncbi:unnamed protein product [Adineta steineri]|uniref:Uncharacterized protein n=1 Tax=Adineta steineri TaxID=433720 RepID=A0A819JSC5_9BILA|nr:unnamed protein product [Adineta steineri]CAF3934497.1 unnamed protein product [Adineta steineri]